MTITTKSTDGQEISNAAHVYSMTDLDEIHQNQINIAIYHRNVDHLRSEIVSLLEANKQIRLSGSKDSIINKLSEYFNKHSLYLPLLMEDYEEILNHFEKNSNSSSFRFHLLTVDNNMCSKFHADIHDLRLLCTCSGPGTYWLPSQAENRLNHHIGRGNDEIVIDPLLIQQANTGDVLILKGALYPNAEAVIHKSPSIKDSKEKRLLLRIDTNEFGSFV